ncbi:hypothetical protein EV426DRAFT_540467 [Tirmania nivea]|nr:hypothetical protein EV426DRAFT_540467 [Tirmania nivea]
MPPLPRLLVLTSLFSVILVLLIATSALPGYGLGFSGGRGGGLSARTPSLFPKSAIITLTDDVTTFFLARPAAFGPELPDAGGSGGGGKGGGGGGGRGREKGLTGRLVAVPDGEDGCGDGEAPPGEDGEETGNALDDGYINGRIVLIPRGGCGFLEKVLWAQRRGALAVVVGDNVSGRGLVTMYAKGDTSNVAIPSIFTTHTTAQLLISLIPRPPTFTPTLPLDPTRSHAPGFHYEDHRGRKSNGGGKREGLWVTLTCTPGPASPLLDTLLVLVVSPLGTLGIVYSELPLPSRVVQKGLMDSSDAGDKSEAAEEEVEGAKECGGEFAGEGVYGAEWGGAARGGGDRWGGEEEKEKEKEIVRGYAGKRERGELERDAS